MKCENFMKLMNIMEYASMLRNALVALSPEDVVDGVLTFPKAVAETAKLQDRLPHARAWYAVHAASKGWVLAPSKWAGYVRMTPQKYLGSIDNLDGRQTEKRLSQWFSPLVPGTKLHKELMGELRQFLAQYGKEPNSAVRISVIPDRTTDEASPDDLVQLIVRVVKSLPAEQQRLVLQGLGS